MNLDVRAVVLVTIVLTAVWAVVAVIAYREYGANLREVLSRRAWDPVAIRIDDDVSRCGRVLFTVATSGTPRRARSPDRRGSPTVTAHVTE